jgi:hypothetical protein
MDWLSFAIGAAAGLIGGVVLGAHFLLKAMFPKGFSFGW